MALTKITGQVINTTTDVTVGILTVTDTLAVGGTVSVGGTLTYEDVTNIDSIGIITARSTIDAQGDVSIADKIIHTGDTNTAIRFPAADTISFETAGSPRARIDSSGRFLIGTTTEGNESADELTINSSGNTGVTVRSGTSSNGSLYFSDATSGADEYAGFVQYQHASTNAMIFGTSSTEKLRIASDGSATFTTSGGDDAILIKGDTYTTLKIQSARDSSQHKAFIQLHASRGSNASPTIIQNGDIVGTINARAYDGNSYASMSDINFEVDGAPGDGDMPGRIVFKTSADGSESPTERLRIESTGDVIFKNNGGDNRIERDTTSGGPYLLFHNRGTGTTDSSGVYNLGGISAAGYRDVANPGIVGSIQFERQPTAGGASSGCDIVFRAGFNGTTSHTGMSEKMRLTYEGHLVPGGNDQYDLGSSSLRWRDIYTGDLNLSNKGKSNDVDGSWGDYTIQEGESDLFLINNRSGKKFKFNLTEVS